jgi:hypothetical protein
MAVIIRARSQVITCTEARTMGKGTTRPGRITFKTKDKETANVIISHSLSVPAARNTKDHNQQSQAAMMDAETRRAQYELRLREYNDRHPRHHKVDPTKSLPSPSAKPAPTFDLRKLEGPKGHNSTL